MSDTLLVTNCQAPAAEPNKLKRPVLQRIQFPVNADVQRTAADPIRCPTQQVNFL